VHSPYWIRNRYCNQNHWWWHNPRRYKHQKLPGPSDRDQRPGALIRQPIHPGRNKLPWRSDPVWGGCLIQRSIRNR